MTVNYLIREDQRVPLIEEPNDPSSELRLAAIMASHPITIAVRGIVGWADLQHVSSRLAVQEALQDRRDGETRLWAVVGETPASIRSLTKAWPRLPRLSGVVFSCRPILAKFQLGSDTPIEGWPDALRMGRNLTVLKALELTLPAYEWIEWDRDPSHARTLARRDGFSDVVAMQTG
jgi:hypothetical protein